MLKQEEKILSLCEEGTSIGSIRYTTTKNKMELVCRNGHVRLINPSSILYNNSGIKCKSCINPSINPNGGYTQGYIKRKIMEKGYDMLEGAYTAYNNPLEVILSCGHTYTSTAKSILMGKVGSLVCKTCNPLNKLGLTVEEKLNLLYSKGITSIDSEYLGVKSDLSVTLKCGHPLTSKAANLFNIDYITCNICDNTSIRSRFFSKLIEADTALLDEYKGTQVLVNIEYRCGHKKSTYPNDYVTQNSNYACRICNYVGVSAQEVSLVAFIESIYSGWKVYNDRSILGGKELDLVLPDLGIAFEYNGIYWHSENKKSSDYHLNKTSIVESFDYRLIHINEDEWLNKRSIVESRVRSLLGSSEKLYARKGFSIEEIAFPKEFLNINHIQGAGAPSSINLGLFYEKELYAVMTFSTPKFYNADSVDYELVRYCSKLNTTIVGGAGKLLKYFRGKYPSCSIMSYSDKRWSVGTLYKSLGFIKTRTTEPGYKYYKNRVAYSRFQFQKSKLPALFPEICAQNPSASESEIMSLAGYLKMYDCGNDVWLLKQ